MQKYIGSDVTSMVTLPVLIFEPMSMVQKMAEVCVAISKLHFCKVIAVFVSFLLVGFYRSHCP